MNRLQTEQRRLYLVADPASERETLMDAQGWVRALVVEVAQQVGWEVVAALCHGIQGDLDLPTPAIAVSGGAGFQVWLSLVEPVPVAEAQTFLGALCQRFLSQVPARHVRCMPSTQQGIQATLVPAPQGETGRWSAFVAPGLASMFADEPWLDAPPGVDAQAQLLSRLESISPSELVRASSELGLRETPLVHVSDPAGAPKHASGSGAPSVQALIETDPRRFLLSVMNDPDVEMALRIKAAKALLP